MDDQKVSAQLDVLIRLTAINALGDKSGGEAIAVLARGGLDNEVIADLVGTTTATVRAARSRMRKKGAS